MNSSTDNSPLTTGNSPAIPHGCSDPACGYSTRPSTMGTPYIKCPLCGSTWMANPPPQLKNTGMTIDEFSGNKKTRTIMVRPHMYSLYNKLETQRRQQKREEKRGHA